VTGGFLKLVRGEQTVELLKHPNTFTLLAVIAYRARRRNLFDNERLGVGEALLGDYANYGLTEQQYRTAKTKLQQWRFATFKSTSRGTVARLVDNGVFDINSEENGGESTDTATDTATDKQRTNNGQTTSNKNIRTKERKKKPPISPPGGAIISQELLEQFEEARTLYPGDKRGLDTEFENLKRKHRDWREIVPALLPSLDLQIARREKMRAAGEFVPNWKHFKTYINERCWEAKSG